jgi:hypothetical protein
MTPEEYFKKYYVNKSNGMLKPAKWVMEFADSYHKKQLTIHSVVDTLCDCEIPNLNEEFADSKLKRHCYTCNKLV